MDHNISSAASLMGRKGGSQRTQRKISAAQKNGKLGGRPAMSFSTEKTLYINLDGRVFALPPCTLSNSRASLTEAAMAAQAVNSIKTDADIPELIIALKDFAIRKRRTL